MVELHAELKRAGGGRVEMVLHHPQRCKGQPSQPGGGGVGDRRELTPLVRRLGGARVIRVEIPQGTVPPLALLFRLACLQFGS